MQGKVRALLVTASLLPFMAGAATLGDPILHSRRGEVLRVDIPLQDASPERLQTACYRLETASPGGALADARLRRILVGDEPRLELLGRTAITEDRIAFTLVAECGLALRRTYTLALPERTASVVPLPAPTPALRPPDMPPPAPPRRTAPRPAPAPAQTASAPLALPAVLAGTDSCAPAALDDLQQRIARTEQTVRLLQRTDEQLERAAALTEAVLAQDSQPSRPPAPPPPVATPPAVPVTPIPAATVAPPQPTAVPTETGAPLWQLLATAGVTAALAATALVWWRRRRAWRTPETDPATEAGPGMQESLPTTTLAVSPQGPVSLLSLSLPPFNRPHDDQEADAALARSPAPPEEEVEYYNGDAMLELAEVMLSFGRLEGAAETVAEYIEQYSPQNIAPWLMLLDLYRRGNLRQEFEHFSQEVRQRFNVQLPTWESSTTVISGLRTLEDYPHILHRITGLWGTQEAIDYLHSLTRDDRGGQRTGFPLEIVEEIVLLLRVLEHGHKLKRIV